jgi:plastocyanin
MRLFDSALLGWLFVATTLVGCENVVERADGAGGGDAAVDPSGDIEASRSKGPLGGVDVIACPSKKAWGATITTTTGDTFSPSMIRVSRGHIVMFLPAGGADANMVANDGSFRTGDPRETACLKFNVSGTYAYHSETMPDEMTGVVVVE